jgi:hypothetical protein
LSEDDAVKRMENLKKMAETIQKDAVVQQQNTQQ